MRQEQRHGCTVGVGVLRRPLRVCREDPSKLTSCPFSGEPHSAGAASAVCSGPSLTGDPDGLGVGGKHRRGTLLPRPVWVAGIKDQLCPQGTQLLMPHSFRQVPREWTSFIHSTNGCRHWCQAQQREECQSPGSSPLPAPDPMVFSLTLPLSQSTCAIISLASVAVSDRV